MKILVAYFSLKGETIAPGMKVVKVEKGNTARIAEAVHAAAGGTLFEIETQKTYIEDHFKMIEEAKAELQGGIRPALKSFADGDFDVMFLGYPNWWNTLPMPVVTFLEHYDWAGKTIVPFCTSGGGGLGRSVGDIRKYAAGATVTEGFHVNGSEAAKSVEQAARWARQMIEELKN